MFYLKFKYNNKVGYGILEKDHHKKIKIISNNFLKKYKFTSQKIDLNKVKLLAPIKPSKVIAAGLNYIDHAKELHSKAPKTPCIFLKPSSSVIGPEENIIYPPSVKRLDYEAELAIVIKNKIKNLKETEVSKNILGYTCLNDVTARDLQKKDKQWTRAKSFDTFCPLGPYIIDSKVVDGNKLTITSYLNGKLKQKSKTSLFIFRIEKLVSFVSQVMTLLPGDIISTGTPSGIGPMQPGDTIEVKIEKIGVLRNYVVK
jgi:2-keto-4-pentenoate hydratase/2-oxohepta-3-ene-1,7-dioic acid hydratase in catechol pathway